MGQKQSTHPNSNDVLMQTVANLFLIFLEPAKMDGRMVRYY